MVTNLKVLFPSKMIMARKKGKRSAHTSGIEIYTMLDITG